MHVLHPHRSIRLSSALRCCAAVSLAAVALVGCGGDPFAVDLGGTGQDPPGKYSFTWTLFDTRQTVMDYNCDDARQVIAKLAFDLTDAGVTKTTTVSCPAGKYYATAQLVDLPSLSTMHFDLVARALDGSGAEKNRSMTYTAVGINDALSVSLYVLDPPQ